MTLGGQKVADRQLTVPALDLVRLNAEFEDATTEEILRWAWETFSPQIIASSSFQTQSVPLLHLISRACPDMPVVFIDTGFHFPETLAFRDELQARFKLNIVTVHPAVTKSQIMAKYGEALYRRDPDLCCYINKVEPMQRVTANMQAWISGVRRDQTKHRGDMQVLEAQASGPLRIHPMLNWSKDDIATYRRHHDLPKHPLHDKGYLSIGCAPCTRPVFLLQDERAGRWAGLEKKECGLHMDWKKGGTEDDTSDK